MYTTVLLVLDLILPRGHHMPQVMNVAKMTGEAHVWVPTSPQMMHLVYIDHNTCPEFIIWQLLQCQSLFSCFFFLFAPQAITCHW
jgi:hypothetical protein